MMAKERTETTTLPKRSFIVKGGRQDVKIGSGQGVLENTRLQLSLITI